MVLREDALLKLPLASGNGHVWIFVDSIDGVRDVDDWSRCDPEDEKRCSEVFLRSGPVVVVKMTAEEVVALLSAEIESD